MLNLALLYIKIIIKKSVHIFFTLYLTYSCNHAQHSFYSLWNVKVHEVRLDDKLNHFEAVTLQNI